MSSNKRNGEMQTVLVTGGRIRLGAHIAQHLEAQGWTVLRHSSTAEPGFLHADFGNEAAVSRFAEQLPPLDCVIHNAGVLWRDRQGKELIQQINRLTPLALARLVRGSGMQLFIGDADPTHDPDFSSYSASKIMLRKEIPALAAALIPRWRVHLLEINGVLRAPTESIEHFEGLRSQAPLGGITLDDITDTIDFLLRSKRLTGQIISLDGGAGARNGQKRNPRRPGVD
ncbi:MAG: NAD-dependent epimerase/dehydratase family protein [Thalassospira sp.]|jgi:NAD(P)-dependent dehydrogenase (short-subunit alcohol dehydrogenase family)|nr:NAD-dependent epimerase/dehydratase family protein [Thalassospira sp.]